jgi:hypothetical protein
LFACRCDPAWTERRLHAPDCIEELHEDVIERVAAWLRDEATRRAEAVQREDLDLLLVDKVGLSTQVYAGRLHEADALRELADAIDPQPERTTP